MMFIRRSMSVLAMSLVVLTFISQTALAHNHYTRSACLYNSTINRGYELKAGSNDIAANTIRGAGGADIYTGSGCSSRTTANVIDVVLAYQYYGGNTGAAYSSANWVDCINGGAGQSINDDIYDYDADVDLEVGTVCTNLHIIANNEYVRTRASVTLTVTPFTVGPFFFAELGSGYGDYHQI